MKIELIIATIKYSQVYRLLTWTFSEIKSACCLVKFVFTFVAIRYGKSSLFSAFI